MAEGNPEIPNGTPESEPTRASVSGHSDDIDIVHGDVTDDTLSASGGDVGLGDSGRDGETIGAAAGGSHKITWEEKLTMAKEFKTNGNALYKTKKYKVAIGKYHRALLYLKGIIDSQQRNVLPLGAYDCVGEASNKPPEDVMQEVLQLRVDCYNNLAACLLQSEQPAYNKVVSYCENVLEQAPDNTKALYRLGVGLYHLKHLEKALDSLKKAQKLPGGDKDNNIKRYVMMCERGLVRQEEEMKKTYKSMFAKMAKEEKDNSSPESQIDSSSVSIENLHVNKCDTLDDKRDVPITPEPVPEPGDEEMQPLST